MAKRCLRMSSAASLAGGFPSPRDQRFRVTRTEPTTIAATLVPERGHRRSRAPAFPDRDIDARARKALDRSTERRMHAHHPGGILSVTHRARLLEDLPPPPWIVLRTHRR